MGVDPFSNLATGSSSDGDAIYAELRRMAQSMMHGQPRGHTLQATALVHELWIRLSEGGTTTNDQAHLLRLASKAIRQILVSHARHKNAQKSGGDVHVVQIQSGLDSVLAKEGPADQLDLMALDDALDELAAVDERKSQVIELRYFGGLTMAEIADALQISKKTVENDWAAGRAWLHKKMAPRTV